MRLGKYQKAIACSRDGIPVLKQAVVQKEAPIWVRMDTPQAPVSHGAKEVLKDKMQIGLANVSEQGLRLLQSKKRMARFQQLLYTKQVLLNNNLKMQGITNHTEFFE